MLNINFWNIAFTVINLLVLYLFLKHFLMKPLMEIMEKRQAQVETGGGRRRWGGGHPAERAV